MLSFCQRRSVRWPLEQVRHCSKGLQDLAAVWELFANAALEWQARSMRWGTLELMAACPLQGLVRWLNKEHEQHYESIAYSGLASYPD